MHSNRKLAYSCVKLHQKQLCTGVAHARASVNIVNEALVKNKFSISVVLTRDRLDMYVKTLGHHRNTECHVAGIQTSLLCAFCFRNWFQVQHLMLERKRGRAGTAC